MDPSNDQQDQRGRGPRRFLGAALAAGAVALAIPAVGAVASNGSAEPASGGAATLQPVQDQGDPAPERDGDCPKDAQGSGSGSGSSSAETVAPSEF